MLTTSSGRVSKDKYLYIPSGLAEQTTMAQKTIVQL
jgi:hypothetical protein